MPNCFTLSRKTEPSKPVPFATIDDEMRAHFGAPPATDNYYYGWYDIIGLGLATGMTWEQMRGHFTKYDEQTGIAIVNWLEENFVSGAWYAPRSITG